MDIKFNRNGNWFLTASRDHLIKLFDIRNLKEERQVGWCFSLALKLIQFFIDFFFGGGINNLFWSFFLSSVLFQLLRSGT